MLTKIALNENLRLLIFLISKYFKKTVMVIILKCGILICFR